MGIGLTDGESIKRLWSYLGGFSKITKETPQNRVNLLTDGLLNYGRKVKENLGEFLYRIISLNCVQTNSRWAKLFVSIGENYTGGK